VKRKPLESAGLSSGSSDVVTVLGAGPGLGFYVPGAILARRIGRARPVDLQVVEALLPPSKQEITRRARTVFHRDFRAALMGQRLAKDISGELDPAAVDALLQRFREERRREFIVLSGFWAPLLSRYVRESSDLGARIDYCHVDCAPSSSWALVRERPAGARDVWFVRWDGRSLRHRLEIGDEPPLPWAARSGRVLAHGGGWGMGTYRDRVRALEGRGLSLDVLLYEPADLGPPRPNLRQFMLDPAWWPFEAAKDPRHWFPPLGELDASGELRFVTGGDFPPLFELTRRAQAVISKPGGGTLIDSLAAATPLILIEPFGDYEGKNGALWTELGFAIGFDDWVAGGCRLDVLESLHQNLLAARARTPPYEGCDTPTPAEGGS